MQSSCLALSHWPASPPDHCPCLAIRQDPWIDYGIRVFSIGGLAIPSFWTGILILLFLVLWFEWGPPIEFASPFEDPWENTKKMIWPIVTVGYRFAAVGTRMTRSSVLEVLREDYIRTAWAKGLRERVVVVKHVLRNSLLPVVTIIGGELDVLLGGLVVTETVFTLNGVGGFLVDAIAHRQCCRSCCSLYPGAGNQSRRYRAPADP